MAFDANTIQTELDESMLETSQMNISEQEGDRKDTLESARHFKFEEAVGKMSDSDLRLNRINLKIP